MAPFDDAARSSVPPAIRRRPSSLRVLFLPPLFIIDGSWEAEVCALSDQKHENARGSRAAASGRNNESKYGQWKTSGHKRTKKRSLRVTKDRARKSTVDIRFGQTRGERERENERKRKTKRNPPPTTSDMFVRGSRYCRKPPTLEPISTVADVSVICHGLSRISNGHRSRPEIISSLSSVPRVLTRLSVRSYACKRLIFSRDRCDSQRKRRS